MSHSLQQITDMDPGQLRAVDFVCQHYRSVLWLEMSSGKSLIWLTAISHLLQHGLIRGALVLAPAKVAQVTWPDEIAGTPWLKHLRIARLYGGGLSAKAKLRDLLKPADVYIANYEQLPWLEKQISAYYLSQGQYPPFDCLILDELSRLKNSRMAQGAKAYQRLKTFLPYMRFRSGGTGTPAAKGLRDLFGQYLPIDDGHRLGTSYSAYADRWFRNRSRDARYMMLEPLAGAQQEIIDRVKDITFEMRPDEKAKLPDYTWQDLWVDLPPKAQTKYDAMEDDLFVHLDKGEKITAPNILALRSALRQLANGAIYTDKELRLWDAVHDAKLSVLKQLVESLQGQPLLLSYMYLHDWERIEAAFKGRAVRVSSELNARQMGEVQTAWNRGEIEVLAGHHASIGHGLNLQHGGHTVCWFGCDEHTADFLQFNARLARRNQQADSVNVYRILARNTIDEAIIDTLRRDIIGQRALRDHLLDSVMDYRRRKENLSCQKTA